MDAGLRNGFWKPLEYNMSCVYFLAGVGCGIVLALGRIKFWRLVNHANFSGTGTRPVVANDRRRLHNLDDSRVGATKEPYLNYLEGTGFQDPDSFAD
jgi:hypothetical protein